MPIDYDNADLPELAAIALDGGADIRTRLAALESLSARIFETADSWSSYSRAERAALHTAYTIDIDAMTVGANQSARIAAIFESLK